MYIKVEINRNTNSPIQNYLRKYPCSVTLFLTSHSPVVTECGFINLYSIISYTNDA